MDDLNIFWSFYGVFILTVLTVVYYVNHTLFTKRNLRAYAGLVHLKTLSSLGVGAGTAIAFYWLRVDWGGDDSEPAWLVMLLLFASYSVATLLWDLLGKVLMRDVSKYIAEHGAMPALKLVGKRLGAFSPVGFVDSPPASGDAQEGSQG